MNNLINEVVPFYNMLLWLNMRTNAKKNMVLGDSILESSPFKKNIENSGLENILKTIPIK
jgi:hypothetical protein